MLITAIAFEEVHVIIEALLVGLVATEGRPLLLLHPATVFAGQHIGRIALPLAMGLDAEQVVAAAAVFLANDRLAPASFQCGLGHQIMRIHTQARGGLLGHRQHRAGEFRRAVEAGLGIGGCGHGRVGLGCLLSTQRQPVARRLRGDCRAGRLVRSRRGLTEGDFTPTRTDPQPPTRQQRRMIRTLTIDNRLGGAGGRHGCGLFRRQLPHHHISQPHTLLFCQMHRQLAVVHILVETGLRRIQRIALGERLVGIAHALDHHIQKQRFELAGDLLQIFRAVGLAAGLELGHGIQIGIADAVAVHGKFLR